MVKKKSKFRHISINKKKFYFYEIKRFDSLGDTGQAIFKELYAMIQALILTRRYVNYNNKKHLITYCI